MKAALAPAGGPVRSEAVYRAAAEAARFRQLTIQMLRTRLTSVTMTELARFDHAYIGGQQDGDVYLIEQGQVKSQIVTAGGKRCLLSIYAGGDVFGEAALLGVERPDTAVALTRTVLWRVPVERFRAALKADGLEDAYLRYLHLRLLDQQRIIAHMATMSSELRLAVRLLDLAARFGSPCRFGVQLLIRLTQEDLAEMVGTTRTRVGQFLTRFRQAGLIQLSRQSHLLIDELRLAGWIQREASLPRQAEEISSAAHY